jgi:YD repeat-containing protein
VPDLLPQAGQTQFAYDDNMRLQSILGADGRHRTIQYDDAGRVRKKAWPFRDAATDRLRHTYDYDAHGVLTPYTDGTGAQTTFAPDNYDRVVTETAPGARADTVAGSRCTGRRPRGTSAERPHARRPPRQHHALLADQHRRLGGSALLGEQAGLLRRRRHLDHVAISVFPDELYQAPRSWAERDPDNLIHYDGRSRRPLRRLGAARALLRGAARRVPIAARVDGEVARTRR